MMTIHKLKTWPEPFAAVLDGRKTYEICEDDRGYKVGDRLLLREWMPDHAECSWPPHDADGYTGRSLLVEVTYKTPGGAWGLPAGLCVMAIRRVDPTP